MHSYVYLFPLKNGKCFKVGKSINPYVRFNQLLKYHDLNKNESILYRCENEQDSFELEGIVHKSFKNKRVLVVGDGGSEFFSFSV
jgi:hypothetical protein